MAGPLAVEGEFETIDQLMFAAARQIGDREAYVEVATGQRLTFAEWVDAASRVAAHLRDVGVGRGDVVAIAMAPSIDFAIGCAGALLAGAVATGINTRLGPREIAGIFARCAPKLVIRDESFVVPDSTGGISPPKVIERSELVGLAESHAPLGDRDGTSSADDPAVIIWTSGTTGIPKGAWFDHRNLAAAVQTAGEMSRAFDRRLSGIPMAHAGYMAKIWEQFALGLTLVLTPTPWSAAVMLDVLVDERITVGAGVPTQWAKLLELPATEHADLSALRLCLAATAPAAPELIERMTTVLGAPVVVRYAMTESPSISGTTPDDPPEVQFRTVGRPQNGVQIRLVDESGGVDDLGGTVPQGAVGRVQVTGPCVMRGYWRDPDQTAAAIDADGWLSSGDLGHLDDDGNLILVGRAGDMYIRGGYNVYPLEVENVVAENPGVATVAVIGVPAPVIGEIGVAYVVAERGGPQDHLLSLGEMRSWVRKYLADYKAPDELVIVEALPLTPMGKVDKVALRVDWDRRGTN